MPRRRRPEPQVATVPGPRRRRARGAAEDTSIDDLLRGEARAVTRLADADRIAWKRLAAHMREATAAPPALVLAMLAIDDREGWLRRLFKAFMGLPPDDGLEADFAFRRWFAAGLADALPATDPRALEARLDAAIRDEAADAATRTRALVRDLVGAGASPEHRALLGRALLLLARQRSDDLAHAEAIAAAGEALAVFASLGDDSGRLRAERMEAVAMLRDGQLDEALARLDRVGHRTSSSRLTEGASRYVGAMLGPDGVYRARTLAPLEQALYDAGTVALWAGMNEPALRAAFGVVAAQTGHAGIAARAQAPRRDDDDSRLDQDDDDDSRLPAQMR